MSRREFQFVEGTSRKFWAIELSGSQFKVEWGRIGTAGQAQTKTFGSDAEAKRQYDKLIAEKTGKGYAEVQNSTPTAAPPPKPSPAPKPVPQAAAPEARSASPAPAAASASRTTVPATLEIKREIHLDPADWQFATWRKRSPLPRPTARPFDQEQCAAALAKIRPAKYGWDWKWDTLGIPDVMTRAEAEFWLRAMGMADRHTTPEEVAKKLSGEKFTGDISSGEIAERAATAARLGGDDLLKVVANLVSVHELIGMLLEFAAQDPRKAVGWQFGTESIVGFRRFILPYLSENEVAEIRHLAEPIIDPKNWPADHYHRPSPAFFLGAMCGAHDKLLSVVEKIGDDTYTASGWDHSYYHQTQLLILGLGSADLIQAHMRRLRLRLNREDQIRGWLAATEFSGLDYLRDSILKETNAEEAAKQLSVMALVEAPEAAPHMLELKISSRAPRVARGWLEKYPASAIAGLAPVAGGRGALADAAVDYLLEMNRKGYGDAIRQAAPDSERVTREVLERPDNAIPEISDSPAWLVAAVDQAAAQRGKLPGWIDPGALPPVILEVNGTGRRLNDEQVRALCMALQKNDLTKPHPLIAGLKQHAVRESLDKFAWKLFEGWTADGAPSKEKWALLAIGAIGGDGCVLKITPLLRAWPGESQHQRAVTGLECLRSIGTDTALMALNGIAQKLKFKGLKAKAMEMMEAIAADRKMTRAELEDRIVPECDLDEKGTRIFDFGPRQFRFVLGPEMKPMLKDAENKVRGELPAPNTKDDPAKAAAAVEAWKTIKKTVKEVAKVQAVRLEQSMVTGRRWDPASFDLLMIKHPLMTNLARLLIWGGYDAAGKLTTTFRVTEDLTCADEQDETCSIAGAATIGIVHPAHLSEQQRQRWGEILSDYELIPPFKQLGRTVYALEGNEPEAREITRFKDKKIEPLTMVGMLERMSWQRGVPEDGGVVHEHSKPFYGANVTAVLEYEIGVPVGYIEGWEDQRMTRCFFVPGIYTPTMYPQHKDAMQLKEVDFVVMSEVLRDLTTIAAKAK